MGTAKVIFLSGLYIILGVYTVGFNKANDAVRTVANSGATFNQAAQIAQTSLQFAVKDLPYSSMPTSSYSMHNVAMMGGTASYSTDFNGLPANQLRVTASGTYNGQTVTTVTILKYVYTQPLSGPKKRWNSWQVVQTNMNTNSLGSTIWN